MPVVSPNRMALYALLAANAVSLLGNVVAAVAIPWFVLVTTGSAARTGLAAFFTTVPLALGALFGGPIADRIGPRRASVVGDLLSAAAIAAIPLLSAVGALKFWHLLALGFLGSLFDAPSQAARQALLPELAERASMPLERANSLYKGTEHVGYVLGAPATGALIATIGAANALWADAGSFVLAALAVAFAVPAAHRPVSTRRRYLSELLDGLSFIAREPLVRAFLVLPALGNFLISPLAPVVLPIYARQELGGADAFAALMGAYGAGGLLGVIVFGAIGNRLPRRPVYLTLALAYPAVSFALVPLPPLAVALVALALVGVVAGAVGPLFHTVRQERTPPELRGRVFATVAAAEAVAIPLGVLVAALVVELFGLRAAFVVFAAGNAVLAVVKATIPAARDLGGVHGASEQRPAHASVPPGS
jgi:MFS family permease